VAPGTRFDVLVAGGGSAGCVLAARLSEDGRRVGLVEAGPDYGPFDEGAGRPTCSTRARWRSRTPGRPEREDRSQLRARIIGGCSAHNACVLLPGTREDYDEWGHGWSHAAIEPYLRRAERQMRRRVIEREELSPWHAAFAEAAGDTAILHPVNAIGTCAGTRPSPTSTRARRART
jgi:choline dehydrogenase